MRTLNVRLAAILLAVVVVFGVGVYFLHGYQVRRNAYVFKNEAELAAKRVKEAAKAKDAKAEQNAVRDRLKNLGWYYRLVPDDLDAAEEFGTLLSEQTESNRALGQAFGLLEQVLREDPTRKTARRKLVDLAMNAPFYRFQDAKEHVQEFLLKEEPENPEYLDLLGRCHGATGDFDAARADFKKVLELDPARVEVYVRLAGLLRGHFSREKEADQWVDKMVKVNPKSAKAHFLRGDWLRDKGASDEALKEALATLEIDKDSREGLWLASQCCLQKRDFDKAREYASRSLKLDPANADMYTLLANIELRAGNREKVIAVLNDGLKATSRSPKLLWSIANVLIDLGKFPEATKITEELKTLEYPKPFIEYLRARNEFAQEHWPEAKQAFEQVRGAMLTAPDLLKQIDVWIGDCYGHTGNREMQMMAYRRALNIDPLFVPARTGLMSVMTATGDTGAAINEYERVSKMNQLGPGSFVPYARMLVIDNLRKPASKRDWAPALKALDDAEKATPDAIQIPILRAEILVAQNRFAEAEALLVRARRENPSQYGLWVVQAALAQRQKNWVKAEQLIEEAQKTWGDTMPQRLALAQLLRDRHGKNAQERIRKLAESTDQFPKAQRLQLWAGLANIAIEVGDWEQAKVLGLRIAEQEPSNVQVRFLLFEQAVRTEDDPGMERALKEIERVAGKGAYWYYGQAVRLSLQAKNKPAAERDALLNQALDDLGRAKEVRKTWARIPLLTASIYDQQGQTDLALQNYRDAIDLGERDPAAVRRMVQLLFQKQQFAEADRLLKELDDQKTPLSSDLNRASAEAALQSGDVDRALDMARKSAAAQSKEFQDHVWLGQMLGMASRRARTEGQEKKADELAAEAEKALRHAVELDPKAPMTWIALLRFLGTNEKEAEAEKLLADVEKKVPAKEAVLTVAQCLDAMGKMDAAEPKYQAAKEADPQNPAIIRAVADFYYRAGKPAPAEALLRQILDGKIKVSEADTLWARRQLAVILASRGGYQNKQKARELIEKNLAAKEASILDRRVKAGLDASDPDRTRREEAIRSLENLAQDKSASPEDIFQLAQMHRTQGAWAQASAMFRKLLLNSGNEPRYLSTYITALLEHDDVNGAESYIQRLETAAPKHLNTVGLRAEILVAKNEPDQALALLKESVDKPGAKPADRNLRVRLAAEKLEQLAGQLKKPSQKAAAEQFLQAAEMLYRGYVDKNPGQDMVLAAFFGRHARTDEALALVDRTWKDNNAGILSQVLSVLVHSDTVGKEQMQRISDILQKALKQFDRPVPLLMIAAEISSKEGRFADAENQYREVLKKNESNAYAMNNLAVLLALHHVKLDEAMNLINQAVDIAGPLGAMLDSRATVYLAMGETQKAMDDVNEAVNDAETPVRLFHQAQALQQAGQASAATQALEKALRKGLTKEMLHPLELPVFEKLKSSAK
jgi:cellulose synthase operon protein C